MQKILVAGGAGFIGSYLCERLLQDGHEVVCIDNLLTGSEDNVTRLKTNPQYTFVEQDITKPLPENLQASAIFHMASPASPNLHSKRSYHALPMETMMVNTQGTLQLLLHAQKQTALFLFASTSEVYGEPLEHPQKETYRGNVSTTGPRSVYDEAKRFGETITSHFWRSEGVNARIVRIFNTYGPQMQKDDGRVVSNFINQALKNESLTVYGEGTQTRSFCYVEDMVDGLIRAMFGNNTKEEIINLGNPDERTVLEIATMVKELTGSSSQIVHEPLPEDDPKVRKPDITKARTLLEWEPKVTLEDGLLKTIEYFKHI